jgi:hypothetical protein
MHRIEQPHSLIPLLLVLCASALVGCAQPSVSYSNGLHLPRLLWRTQSIDGQSPSPVTTIDFHPAGRQVLLGGGNGVATLWTIGASAPSSTFHARYNWISGASVSPDGELVALASLQQPRGNEAEFKESALYLQVFNMNSVKQREKLVEGRFQTARLAWSPDSRLLVLTVTPFVALFVFDAANLDELPHEDAPDNGKAAIVFFADNLSRPHLVALSRDWLMEERRIKLERELPDQPAAVTPRGDRAFFVEAAQFTEEWVPIGFVVRPAAIVSGDLERKCLTERITLAGIGALYPDHVKLLPGRESVGPQLLVNLRNNVALVDTSSKQYCLLLPPELVKRNADVFNISVSADGRLIAACGTWGAAVWEMPPQR